MVVFAYEMMRQTHDLFSKVLHGNISFSNHRFCNCGIIFDVNVGSKSCVLNWSV